MERVLFSERGRITAKATAQAAAHAQFIHALLLAAPGRLRTARKRKQPTLFMVVRVVVVRPSATGKTDSTPISKKSGMVQLIRIVPTIEVT